MTYSRQPVFRPVTLVAGVLGAVVFAALVALLLRVYGPRPPQPEPVLVRSAARVSIVALGTSCSDGRGDVAYVYSFRVRPTPLYSGATAVLKVHGSGGDWVGYDHVVKVTVRADGSFGWLLLGACRTGGQVEVSPVTVGGRVPGVSAR